MMTREKEFKNKALMYYPVKALLTKQTVT